MLARPLSRSRRLGAALPWLVVTAPVLLAVFGLAIQVTSLRHRQQELQNAVDAAAAAAAQRLASDDRLLTDQPKPHAEAHDDARASAHRYAGFNSVNGKPLMLEPNPTNDPEGELVLGSLPHALSKTFNTQIQAGPDGTRPPVNAVRVSLKRGGAAAAATAYLDQDIVGFQLQGNQTLPLAPLAVRTDPCPPGLDQPGVWAQKDPQSWEYQILARKGADAWTVDPITEQPKKGSDQVPEIDVVISVTGQDQKDNGCLTAMGDGSMASVCRQLGSGLSAQDLSPRHGKLMLDDGLGQRPADNRLLLPHIKVKNADLQQLEQALSGIISMPRIWMLYEKQTSSSGDAVLVRGFVAARVVNVQTKLVPQKGGATATQLVVTLQPCRVSTAAAVTARDRRDLGPRSLFNPYVSRIRLVE